MASTSSQEYGSYYKQMTPSNAQRHTNNAFLQDTPKNVYSYNCSAPPQKRQTQDDFIHQDKLVGVAGNKIFADKERLSSPFINGKRNTNFLNRSMMSCEALSTPNYERNQRPQSAQRQEILTRYQPYLASPKRIQKGITTKIGHTDYPIQLSPTHLTPDGKLPWQRKEIPIATVKKLDFGQSELVANHELAAKIQNLDKPGYPHTLEQPPAPIINSQALNLREPQLNSEPVVNHVLDDDDVHHLKKEPESLQQVQNINGQLIPNTLNYSNVPKSANVQDKYSLNDEPKQELFEYSARQQPNNRETQDDSRINKTRDLPKYERSQSQPSKQRIESQNLGRSLRNQNQIPLRDYPDRVSNTFIGKQEAPVERLPENNAITTTSPQEIASKSNGDSNLVPKTPVSGSSQASKDSSASGKDLLCNNCVNDYIKRTKQEEEVSERIHDQQMEKEQTLRLNQAAQREKEAQRRAHDEAATNAQAIKEAIDQKFRQYWERRRNEGLDAEKQRKEQEQKVREEDQKTYNVYKKYQDDYKNDLLKQIEDRKAQEQQEKNMRNTPNQKTSLNVYSPIHNNFTPSKEDVKNSLLDQIKAKEEQRREELQV